MDCVFRGEGEEVFPQWLTCWNQPELWNDIAGLCYLDTDKQYRDNGTARVLNFSRLIPPEKSCFFNWDKPFVQLETTRGCFNTCAFCVSGGEKPIRTLSIENIRQRLQTIHEHGIKNIRVLDRTFNYNTHRAKELLQLFLEYPDIHFHLEIHPALLSEELKEELKQLPQGLLHLEAGIQSLREPVLEQSHRMGKLSDALKGLKFLCSLPNMETHADLIAGLPLYHLYEIFEDVYTLAGYNAGRDTAGITQIASRYGNASTGRRTWNTLFPLSSLRSFGNQRNQRWRTANRPPAVSPVRCFLQYSRLAYTSTRELILNDKDFLHNFLKYLIQVNLIDQPMSLEKRGLILYEYCKLAYPEYKIQASIAWIEAGMSLKKTPAEKVKTKHQIPPEKWEVIYGEYKSNLRLCFLPLDENTKCGYWFGFETEIQRTFPVFKAKTDI